MKLVFVKTVFVKKKKNNNPTNVLYRVWCSIA